MGNYIGGTTTGVIKRNTRNLDYGSYGPHLGSNVIRS